MGGIWRAIFTKWGTKPSGGRTVLGEAKASYSASNIGGGTTGFITSRCKESI